MKPQVRHRRSRVVLLLLAATVVFGGMVAGARSADLAAADEPWAEAGWSGGELPNVSVVLRSISSSDPLIEGELLGRVERIDGVESAFVDVLAGGPPVVHLVISDAGQVDRVVAEIRTLSDGIFANGEVLVGGQLVADSAVVGAIQLDVLIALLPVLLVLGFVVAALYGPLVGLVTALAVGLASFLGALIGSSVVGSFDGSLATTAVPGALVGLLIGSILSFRLISWFKHPPSNDAADNILAAVKAQLFDIGLVLASLGVVMVAGLLFGGWQGATACFMAAVFGSLTILATMPAFLATQGSVPDNSEFAAVPIKVADGRDLPVVVVAGVAALLLGLGVVAASSDKSGDLIDAQTDSTEMASLVSLELVRLGGDPSSAIRATASAEGESFAQWAAAASRHPGVEWVVTSAGRLTNGELVSSAETSTIEARTAIINPVESARAEQTQRTVRALREITTDITVDLEGLPVDAERSTEAATTNLWITVGLLAAMAGAVVFVLVRDPGLSVLAVALRLLTSAASLGAYYLVVEDVTSSELIIVVITLSIGISLFEIGLIRMLIDSEETLTNPVSTAMRSGGGHALAGLAVLALAGIGLLSSGIEMVAAFGIALAVAVVIEAVLGIWLLRPVILGEQTLRTLSSNVNTKGRNLLGRRGPVEGEPVNPEWRRVVSGLLREEFRFQTEPDDADLGTVFVEDTPLFGELQQHNLRLRKNGLKIRGEGPTVVSVKAVNNGDPVTVAITVDHPSRQLLASNGKLLGVRAAERRDGMLWLSQDPSGRYRIAEAVDMGSGVPIPDVPAKEAEPAKAK